MENQQDNGNLYVALIEAENFLLLSQIHYQPRKGLNVFAGKNSQGKTDIIRLFKTAFKGAGAEVIQKGKDKTTIYVKLSDGHEIKRGITKNSRTCKITTPNGDYKASPQTYLESILGDIDLSFDPISFVLKEPKEQQKMFLETFNIQITPEELRDLGIEEDILNTVDFNKDGLEIIKDIYTIIYNNRAVINKDITNLNSLIDIISKDFTFDITTYEGDKTDELNEKFLIAKEKLTEALTIKRQAEGTQNLVNKLYKEIEICKENLTAIDLNLIEKIPFYRDHINQLEAQIANLQAELNQTKKNLENAERIEKERKALIDKINNNEATLRQLPTISDIPNIKELEDEIFEIKQEIFENENNLENFKKFNEICSLKEQLEEKKRNSNKLTNILKILRENLPKQIIQKANIPFQNIEFTEDDLIINNTRLSMMSTSEQLKFALDFYLSRNKNAKLKLILVDRIEVLDDENYEYFWKWCLENNVQAIATKVFSTPKVNENTIIMENGSIKIKED